MERNSGRAGWTVWQSWVPGILGGKTMKSRAGWLLTALALLGVLVSSTPALAGSHIVDDAQMFSSSTVDDLNRRIDRMGDAYGKEVFIITVPGFEGRTPDAIAARYTGGRTVDGMTILIA